jgi:hypothetical protein
MKTFIMDISWSQKLWLNLLIKKHWLIALSFQAPFQPTTQNNQKN